MEKPKRKINQGVYISIVVYAIMVFFIYFTKGLPDSSSTYPKYLAYVGIAINSLYLLDSVKRTIQDNTEGQSQIHWKESKYSLGVAVLFIAYAVLFKTLGYFIGTAVFSILLLLFCKVRSVKTLLLTTGGYVLAAYLVFVVWLHVPVK